MVNVVELFWDFYFADWLKVEYKFFYIVRTRHTFFTNNILYKLK